MSGGGGGWDDALEAPGGQVRECRNVSTRSTWRVARESPEVRSEFRPDTGARDPDLGEHWCQRRRERIRRSDSGPHRCAPVTSRVAFTFLLGLCNAWPTTARFAGDVRRLGVA